MQICADSAICYPMLLFGPTKLSLGRIICSELLSDMIPLTGSILSSTNKDNCSILDVLDDKDDEC